jgi:SH3-like domain-containing protein
LEDERDMYAALTRTQGSNEEPIEVATMVGEEMYRWLRDIDGFKGLLVLTNVEARTTSVVALWESREIAERHRLAREQLRDRVTAAVDVEVLAAEPYDVAFAALPEVRPTV